MPHSARPTVTLRDVAAAAGVSVSTASRVLGGSSRTVAEEYRQGSSPPRPRCATPRTPRPGRCGARTTRSRSSATISRPRRWDWSPRRWNGERATQVRS
ncbi:LacI family DNA-binding transcriptional regulator [Streptomyces stelliscabiei]